MIRINISEAKTHFSKTIEKVERGETVVVCRRNVAVAEIRPLPAVLDKPRPVGVDPGLVVPRSFFDPLPDELLAGFDGLVEPDS